MKKIRVIRRAGKERLKSFDLFKLLSEQEFEFLVDHMAFKSYTRGCAIYQESSDVDGVYVLLSGIVKQVKSRAKGKELIIRFAKEGDVIGFRSVLSGEVACETSEVLVQANIGFIPKAILNQLMISNNKLTMYLLQQGCNELKNSHTFLLNVAQKKVRERMAEALLLLKEQFDVDYNNTLNIPLSRKELANVVGTAPESAIRMLTDFKKENLVEVQGRQIRLLNINKLNRIGSVSI